MRSVGILGGTGFVGSYIIDELVSSGFNVKMINREKTSLNTNCSQVTINLNSSMLYKEMEGCDCVIYNIGIIREFPNQGVSFKSLHQDLAIHAIDMAEKADVRKFILMTANGVELCTTNYQRTKFNAERRLISSKLSWTIFRPSIIFGDPRGKMEFCSQIKKDMLDIPIPAPLFFKGFKILNAGAFKMSPIHVKNVAQFFVKSINKEDSNSQIYEIGGSRYFSWKEIIKIISAVSNKKKYFLPIPVILIRFLAFFFQRWSWFPITSDQLSMLISGNVCDSDRYFNDFGIDEIKFDIKNLDYLS